MKLPQSIRVHLIILVLSVIIDNRTGMGVPSGDTYSYLMYGYQMNDTKPLTIEISYIKPVLQQN